ncbi:hypothetical protein QBC35DRAFT_488007 [Podospora australis]|uniref:Homeobox domain-containing protein n=1 Tax=Podospora australis TaxID=1536484 RepID=A0AAN6WZ65_9PEZI|nr:hypothetical protein QBC35DRAFT_488007 [Podospora australis]
MNTRDRVSPPAPGQLGPSDTVGGDQEAASSSQSSWTPPPMIRFYSPQLNTHAAGPALRMDYYDPEAAHRAATIRALKLAEEHKWKPLKARLSTEEAKVLEDEFARDQKPKTEVKRELADRIGVDVHRINNWFQNRRAKEKLARKNQEGYGHEDDRNSAEPRGATSGRVSECRDDVADTRMVSSSSSPRPRAENGSGIDDHQHHGSRMGGNAVHTPPILPPPISTPTRAPRESLRFLLNSPQNVNPHPSSHEAGGRSIWPSNIPPQLDRLEGTSVTKAGTERLPAASLLIAEVPAPSRAPGTASPSGWMVPPVANSSKAAAGSPRSQSQSFTSPAIVPDNTRILKEGIPDSIQVETLMDHFYALMGRWYLPNSSASLLRLLLPVPRNESQHIRSSSHHQIAISTAPESTTTSSGVWSSGQASLSRDTLGHPPHHRIAKKHPHDGDDDEADDDQEDGERGNKRQKSSEHHPQRRLACPYFKRNPNYYQEWRTCPGPGWTTTHRVKEHLYRCHTLPITCPRCHTTFETPREQLDHLATPEKCEPLPEKNTLETPEQRDGFDQATEKILRCRKLMHKHSTEEDRWREIYLVLFPGADPNNLPSPYYEHPQIPIQAYQNNHDSNQQQRDTVLKDYEQFLKKELPNSVREELRHRIAQSTRVAKDQYHSEGESHHDHARHVSLKGKMADIVRDVQRLVLFNHYKSKVCNLEGSAEVLFPPGFDGVLFDLAGIDREQPDGI